MTMRHPITPVLAALYVALCCAAAVSTSQAGNGDGLDVRQEAIVPIAAFARAVICTN